MKHIVYIAFVLGVLMPVVGWAQPQNIGKFIRSEKSLEYDEPILRPPGRNYKEVNLEASEYIKFKQDFSYRVDTAEPEHFLKARINKSKSFDINDYQAGFTSYDFDTIKIDTDRPVGLTAGGHSVDLSGGANYNIPIHIPSGTNGMVPSISINYNSNASNGVVGYGWNIAGLSAITRSGNTIFNDGNVTPVKLNDDDHFALDGNLLIPLEGNNGQNNTKYGTKNESFSQITSFKTGNDFVWFKVFTKERATIEFGRTLDSKLMAEDSTTEILWMVNKITDVHGNYITFSYKQMGNQVVIEKIEYTGNEIANLDPYNKIEFFYDIREDNSYAYVAGSKIEINALLRRVEVSTKGIIYKQYQFDYSMQLYSMLKEVTEIDAGGNKLNSTKFKYNDAPSHAIVVNKSGERDNLKQLTSDDNWVYHPGDFNGDGLTDFLAIKYTYDDDEAWYSDWRIFINNNKLGNNGFLAHRVLPKGGPTVPSYLSRSVNESSFTKGSLQFIDDVRIYIGDLNGDLRDDIIVGSRGWKSSSNESASKKHWYYRALFCEGNTDGYFSDNPDYYVKEPLHQKTIIGGKENHFHSAVLGDFDGDRRQELFTYKTLSGDYHIDSFDGRIDVSQDGNLNNNISSNRPFWLVGTDYDGDGTTELIFKAEYINTIVR